MVVGVDSFHLKGKGVRIGMVTTRNISFTNFFKDEIIIKENNNKEQVQYCIISFI